MRSRAMSFRLPLLCVFAVLAAPALLAARAGGVDLGRGREAGEVDDAPAPVLVRPGQARPALRRRLDQQLRRRSPARPSYRFTAPAAGEYELWVRANPIQAKLSYRLNDGPVDPDRRRQGARVDQHRRRRQARPALPRLGEGRQGLAEEGSQRIRFRMDSANNNHGYLDCFVFANEPFTPRGTLKPDQLAAASRRVAEANKGWFAFDPKPDPFSASSGIDLRP